MLPLPIRLGIISLMRDRSPPTLNVPEWRRIRRLRIRQIPRHPRCEFRRCTFNKRLDCADGTTKSSITLSVEHQLFGEILLYQTLDPKKYIILLRFHNGNQRSVPPLRSGYYADRKRIQELKLGFKESSAFGIGKVDNFTLTVPRRLHHSVRRIPRTYLTLITRYSPMARASRSELARVKTACSGVYTMG